MSDYEEAQWFKRCKSYHNYDGLRGPVRNIAYDMTQIWSNAIRDWAGGISFGKNKSWEEIREAFIIASEILHEDKYV